MCTRVASLDTKGDGWDVTIQVMEWAFILMLGCVSVWLSMGMEQWDNHDGRHVEHDHLDFTHT